MTRQTGPSKETVELVRRRDQDRCAICGSGAGLSTHHRRPRGMGGSRWPGINLPSNLLTLCGHGTAGCHGWVEANRAAATGSGLLVSKHSDPADRPVFTWRGWLLLDNEGGTAAADLAPPF